MDIQRSSHVVIGNLLWALSVVGVAVHEHPAAGADAFAVLDGEDFVTLCGHDFVK